MSVELLPHGPPISKGCFTSSYDASYTKTRTGTLRASTAQPFRSGHQINTPNVHVNVKGMQGQVSTAQVNHSAKVHKPLNVDDLRMVAVSAASPKESATAHVRNQSHIGGDHAEGQVPRSTMKDSFQLRQSNTPNTGCKHLHPGSAAVRFNAGFLTVNSPDDVQPSKKEALSPPRNHNPRRDVHLNVDVKKTNPLITAPLDAEAERRLKVSSPVEYHVYKNQRPYMTQSKVYGDTNSVVHKSLANTKLHDSTDKGQIPLVANKRSLLNTLAGYDLKKEKPGSGASRMGGLVHQAGPAPGGRLGGDTTYRAHFFDQRILPERPDPCNTKSRRLDKAVYVSLNKNDIDFSAAKALENVRTSDGGLRSEKPNGVHPSVWTKLQRTESKALTESQDPHRHKRRQQ